MNEIMSLDHDSARKSQIGTRPIRPNREPKVTGAARYRNDDAPPGTWGKILRSPHAHIRSDTSKAEAPPGVTPW